MFAFVLGGLVGAGLATLLSPLSGPEARQRLSDLKDDFQDRAEDYRDHAKETLNSAVSKGKDFVGEKKSILSRAVEAGKDAYSKEKEQS
jgi:gas vesicle protein